MKRKSTQFQISNTNKGKLSKGKKQLIKKNKEAEEKEDLKHNNYSLESTPDSTRSKQDSSLVSSKTKSEAAQNLSFHLSQQDMEEDIPDDQYNEMLKEISRSLNFDNATKHHKKASTIQDAHKKKYEKYSSFQYDHSLHKEISIEVLIEYNNPSKKEYYNEISNEIKKELMSIKDFTYYEFSNIQNISMSNYSKIDHANYEHLYQKIQIMNEKTKRNIKEINFLRSLSSLYQIFINDKDNNASFYFITPMHSFFFSNRKHRDDDGEGDENENENEDCDMANSLLSQKTTIAVLSTTLLLDKQLEISQIRYAKITPSKKQSEDELNSNDDDNDLNMNPFDKQKFNSNPALVEGYYITLLYNMMINEYENKTFNLVSPFPFEGSTYRQNKIKVNSYVKTDKSVYVICINIFGCIFESKLRDIIKLLSKNNSKTKLSKTTYTYSMKLDKIANTCEFFALNPNLSRSIERVEYKDNEYYLK